jgi:hypothetical protein
MVIYATEDAWVAFVAGRITRDEFFDVCQANAAASGESSGTLRLPDQRERTDP